MAELPEPNFIERDAAKVLSECIASFEAKTGRKLEPTQVERIMLDIVANREMLMRYGIQDAAKQNTWRYSRFPMIDYLSEIVGPDTERLAAKPARTTLRFTIAAQATGIPVAKDKRVRTSDGRVVFAVDEDKTIAAGHTFVDVFATATEAGLIGNGYAAGQVNDLLDPLDVPATVANITETNDGAPQEDTETMRARLPDGLALQAAAGPEDAYAAHAKRVSTNITDIAVTQRRLVPCTCGSTPPQVVLTILTNTGEPSPELLAAVLAAVNPKGVRPLCDRVVAEGSVGVEYTIAVGLVLYDGEEDELAITQATTILQEYANARREKLGRAPVAGQMIADVRSGVPSVYDVIVTSPSPLAVGRTEWADCTGITVTVSSHVTERRPGST